MIEFDINTAVNAILARKTPAEREDEARFQAAERAKLHLPTEIDIRAQLGARMVALAQEALDTGVSEFELARLAEGYALQGDYKKALELTTNDDKRKEYEQILTAYTNGSKCDCPTTKGTVSTRFTKDKLLIDGQVRDLIACSLCGNLTC